VVAGGAGVVGECVVRALLGTGARVVVPSRSADRLTAVAERTDPAVRDRLHPVVADTGTETGIARLVEEIVLQHGRPRAVVASLGAWWEGEQFVDIAKSTWDRILWDNLTSHFLVARGFLPVLDLDAAPVYVTLAGIAADHPEPHAAPISITGAAQRMMLRTIAVSDLGRKIRLHEVAIMTPVVTDLWTGEEPQPDWLTGEKVGAYVAGVVSPDFEQRDTLLLEIPS
jgi:NAD(P)-dependent dehydrogenase (short-subunit alcohol dehydrogenase family)